MPRGARAGRSTAGLVAVVLALVARAPAVAGPAEETWRELLIAGGPATGEEPPHPEALHEWWYFTVQNPAGGGGCGPWQAMVTFLADREVASDKLLLTTILEGVPENRTLDYPPGTLRRSTVDAGPGTGLVLGDSRAEGRFGHWEVEARSGDATLLLSFDAPDGVQWRRRAPEGGGLGEITFALRAAAAGSLQIGGRMCPVGGTGYYEHVWGNWSRAPMWGVDHLHAHLDNGWSVYARRTPMRGGGNLFPLLGVDAEEYWPPVMILTTGTVTFEALEVTFDVKDSATLHPQLGVPVPASYVVKGLANPCPPCDVVPQPVELTVTDPALATIFLPATSSGILEGWGKATLRIAGGEPSAGTGEVEFQRFGTRYPH